MCVCVCPSTHFTPAAHMYVCMFPRTCRENTDFFILSLCEFQDELFSVLWLWETHLDQFCLLTSVTPSPSSGSRHFLELVLLRDGARHLSDMAFVHINAWLSTVRIFFFLLIRVEMGWILTFRAVCRVGVGTATAIRINYRLLPLSWVSCWSLWGALSQRVTRLPPLPHFLPLVAPMARKHPTEGILQTLSRHVVCICVQFY